MFVILCGGIAWFLASNKTEDPFQLGFEYLTEFDEIPPSAEQIPFNQMSHYIHYHLDPWYAWATTDGPCQEIGTSKVFFKLGNAEVSGIYYKRSGFYGDWTFTGHLDTYGKACDGSGYATLTKGDITYTATGGFFNDEFHGLILIRTGTNALTDVIETKNAYWFGKRTDFSTSTNLLLANEYDTSTYGWFRDQLEIEELFYDSKGKIVQALDLNWETHVDSFALWLDESIC